MGLALHIGSSRGRRMPGRSRTGGGSDALAYHLYFPKLWLHAGRPVDLPWEVTSLYPFTWELLYGVALALNGPVAAKLLHFSTLIVAAVVVYELSGRYARSANPWMAVAFFITMPTVMWEATTAYIDLALTLHVILALYACMRFLETHRWQWHAMMALNAGIAMATKHLALVVFGIVTVLLFSWVWLERHGLRPASISATMLCLSLILPFPWYLRAWRASGNPFFPELYSVFGARPAERMDAELYAAIIKSRNNLDPPRTLTGYLQLPWEMTIHAERYQGSIGPVFLLTLPAWLLIRRRRAMRALGFFACSYLLFLASPLGTFQMRFLLPVTPALAVLSAAAVQSLETVLKRQFGKGAGLALTSSMAVVCVLNLPFFITLHQKAARAPAEGWTDSIAQALREVPTAVVFRCRARTALSRQQGTLVRCVGIHQPEMSTELTRYVLF